MSGGKPTEVFYVDAVLFDMDGTLVDSIAAVEAAWGAVAEEIGQDPDHVIAATHGKRAVDNLKQFKPHIRSHEMDDAVVAFETTILQFADGHKTPTSRRSSRSGSRRNSQSASRRASSSANRRPSQNGVNPFGLASGLSKLSDLKSQEPDSAVDDDEEDTPLRGPRADLNEPAQSPSADSGIELALEEEEEAFDGAIRILPGVRRMIDAIPEGKYAVATSSARTYAYGAMERVGIVPPKVTITAEHPELKRGKPHPDPFILAAKKLGYDPAKCLVVEDSPSGIKAAVASGGVTIAVCTSHPHEKINTLGAQHVVYSLDQVTVEHQEDGRLKVTIEHPAEAVEAMHAGEVCQGLLPEEVDAAVARFDQLALYAQQKKSEKAEKAKADKAKLVNADAATPAGPTATAA